MRCLWYNDSWSTNIDIDTLLTIQLNYLQCVGNLSLNQSCIVHEQCSSLNSSRCVDEKCTCMEGYTAENLTHCIKCMVFISYYLHRWSYVMPVITNAIICIIMCQFVNLFSFFFTFIFVSIYKVNHFVFIMFFFEVQPNEFEHSVRNQQGT